MEPNFAVSISGRIIAEFEDDASAFLSGSPEFVPFTSKLPIVESLQATTLDLTQPSELERRIPSDR